MAGDPASGESQWLSSGASAFPLMLGAIARARASVRLETFIFKAGMPGDAFLAALESAARRGVRVLVMVDAFGSGDLPDGYWHGLRETGGEVRAFNPLRFANVMVRDHRKLLVCDDGEAFVGGFNIAPEYDGDGVTTGWRDTGLRIVGVEASRLGQLFDAQWLACEERRSWAVRWQRRPEVRVGATGPGLQVLAVSPGRGPGPVAVALKADLERAREATLVSPYFLPTPDIRRAIRKAARRGARVRVVLPALSDVWVSQVAARWLYAGLLRAGVEIHEYQPRILHAKVFLLDDVAYVGSSNLDPRSLHLNFELMVRLERGPVVEAARRDLADMLSRSRPVVASQWASSRGWWQKVKEWWAFSMLYRFDPWLSGWLARSGR